MARKLTQEEFIQKAKEKFPNLDYTKTVYISRNKPITITCPIHGDQSYITAGNFLASKYGCPKCAKISGIEQQSTKTRMSLDKFIEKCKERFGDLYDYSKVDYINNDTKVIIICPTQNISLRPLLRLRRAQGFLSARALTPRAEFVVLYNLHNFCLDYLAILTNNFFPKTLDFCTHPCYNSLVSKEHPDQKIRRINYGKTHSVHAVPL